MTDLTIRPATPDDHDAIWAILEPILRAGEAFALPRDWDRAQALAYWFAPAHHVHVALDGDRVLGAYYLRANQLGAGDHVANGTYATKAEAQGRGVARAMGLHSFETARGLGFTMMQFNLVVATNTRAVALWTGLGMREVGRLPGVFRHPTHGPVDALVMHRTL
ncbi:ribosomal protein S18 acetylase RimI-like enzyme [Methylorubrum rhodinum]|uniref:Ribosomal protein S18 acetylase RimI-like enzyme n=1 Tax=Methylorubrum rhodinum TaxID=29428 RepID=A0A840ZTV7_9HYPH|nr:GNAT family N-acetyltransferase [Methylorubrum rhodinum]MBB5760073.1 ribosomal protein S18 acetylase RimI-like enzyme [Methylorubrum rhodinum]